MKQFTVTFYDAGNCDIFTCTVSAHHHETVVTHAMVRYVAAGHPRADIKGININEE